MLYTVTYQNPHIPLICLPDLPSNSFGTRVESDIRYIISSVNN